MNLLFYLITFLLGAFVGSQVNRAIWRFAWNAKLISPWSQAHPDASPRTALDRMPIIGWWAMRRDGGVHGRNFWIRPLLIEAGMAIGFAALFHFIVIKCGLLPPTAAGVANPWHCLVWYAWYLFLISLMVIATFIDFDERIIPDEVTVPGTLVGLLLATLIPAARLPEASIVTAVWQVTPMHPGSPGEIPGATPGAVPAWVFAPASLWIVLGCFLVWCYALLPVLWTTRKGLSRMFGIAWASLRRPVRKKSARLEVKPRSTHPWTWIVVGIAIVGAIGIAITWSLRVGHPANWEGLVSAMVGMAFGGGIVWWIRVIGFITLGREAMGFGDVTLMAMIGAFVGWQASLLIFMFAPVIALTVVLLMLVFSRDNELAFGPYLCISALIVMCCWSRIWNDWAADGVFGMMNVLMPVLIAGMLLAAPLLYMMRLIKTKILGYTD